MKFFLPYTLFFTIIMSCQYDDLNQRIDNLSDSLSELQQITNLLELKNVINNAYFTDLLILEMLDENNLITVLFEDGSLYEFSKDYIDNITQLFTANPLEVETRIIEVNNFSEIIFEMTLSSDIHTGTTYRAEKLILD